MKYIYRRVKRPPLSRQRKLIEQYIRINERIENILEALSRPGDYSVKEYDELTSEYRGLEWQKLSVGNGIIIDFGTVARLYLCWKNFYPKADMAELVARFHERVENEEEG